MPLTDFVDRFYDLTRVFLEGKTIVEATVTSVKSHKNSVLMRFEGVDTRNAAEELIGRFVSLHEAELVQLPEQTYFQFDIIGMRVFTEDNCFLGTVAEIIPAPANDIWRVEGEKEFLLPAIGNVIVKVDKVEKIVIIRLLDGLLDQ